MLSLDCPAESWPGPFANDASLRVRFCQAADRGVTKVRSLFPSGVLPASNVHPDEDTVLQGKLLSLASMENGRLREREIESKVAMAVLSHVLDDLVDGGNVVRLTEILRKDGELERAITPHDDETVRIFDLIYRDPVRQRLKGVSFSQLLALIGSSARSHDNRGHLFAAMNRVAVGAVLFCPQKSQDPQRTVSSEVRTEFLNRHNEVLMCRLEAEIARSTLQADDGKLVLNLLQSGHRDLPALLGLCTKTVQEMAMASEQGAVSFALSLLHDLAYAPLLYLHDIEAELQTGEMAPVAALQAPDAELIQFLGDIVTTISFVSDARAFGRALQRQMVTRCFSPKIPASLRPVYEQFDRQAPASHP